MNACYKRPRVKAAIDEACRANGITIDLLFAKGKSGKKSSLKPSVVAARHHVIRKLYDPSTAKSGGTIVGLVYGAAEIGRVLNIDHTTVVYAVKKMGIHPNANT